MTENEAYNYMFRDYPDVVGIKEMGRMMGVGTSKAYKLVRSGEIPVLKCTNSFKAAKISVISYILNNLQKKTA